MYQIDRRTYDLLPIDVRGNCKLFIEESSGVFGEQRACSLVLERVRNEKYNSFSYLLVLFRYILFDTSFMKTMDTLLLTLKISIFITTLSTRAA